MDVDAELAELETKFKKEKPEPETKVCRICGKEYPADRDHFYSAPTCKDGLDTRCKGCVKSINLAAQQNADAGEKTSDVPPEKKVIQVDFTDHPHLYDWLEETAHKEFRTPEMQVLAIISMDATDVCSAN